MSRKIVPASPVQPTPSQYVELDTGSPCQVYPRVSTPEQKKNVSAEMQQDKSFAILCGWVDDGVHIIVDTDDLGVSGQLKMEERVTFVKMLRRIANGEIKTVIAAQVDRLFRDRWGAEYSKFMEICYTYGVKVVTPNATRTAIEFIYDFSVNWHVDKFRRKCEEAWSYMENHVYGRMLPAQEKVWLSGC
jgi:predicted site-specific integrase-resolvase